MQPRVGVFVLLCLGIVLAAVIVAESRPATISLSRADDAGPVHPGRILRLSLSRAAGPEQRIALLDSRGAAVPAAIRYDDSRTRVVIEPSRPLQWSASYDACLQSAEKSPPSARRLVRLLRHFESCAPFTTRSEPSDIVRPDAPILVIAGRDNPFASYYPEILKAEGLDAFATASAARLSAEDLRHRAVVLVATSRLPASALVVLAPWVRSGGVLIAMRPQAELWPVMGLKSSSAAVAEKVYFRASRTLPPSRGIAGDPIRIHGPADRFELPAGDDGGPSLQASLDPKLPPPGGGAPSVVARLEVGPGRSLSNPAVTMRSLGKGHAIAFAFDLARSVALTRQGNPLWAGEDRDGSPPRRPNDLFYPDFVDLDRAAIPQADEQQRLLANLIVTAAGIPLPRFWYLPDRRRAVIIMAGDDHATRSGTRDFFAELAAGSPAGCRLERWECLRATAFLTPDTRLAPAVADRYQELGFEFGVHVDTGCNNQEDETLALSLASQLRKFQQRYPELPKQRTNRIHCIVWNGWTDVARLERADGLRLDMNYYYWPPRWIAGRPGFMTGSGLPMPFVDEDGNVLDIYQAATHLVNEDGVPQAEGVRSMIERALGAEQFFGAFGTHFDYSDRFSEVLLSVARQHGVALVTADQMLSWLDGRNSSRFDDIAWQNSTLRFTVHVGAGAEAAFATLPFVFDDKEITAITCGSERLSFEVETLKGLETALFPAREGRCEAVYTADVRPGPIEANGKPQAPGDRISR